MKKIGVALAILVFFIADIFAALQYDAKSGAAGSYSAIKQSVGVGVEMISSGSLFLQGGSLPSGMVEFGYYVVGKEVAGAHSIDMTAVPGKGVFVGNFSEGDQVAFWAKGADGELFDSIHGDRKGDDRFAAYLGDNGAGTVGMVVGSGGYGGGYGPAKGDSAENGFSFELVGGEHYDASAAVPSGAPLPGVVAAVAVGGAFVAARRWRRSRGNRVK